MGGGGFGWVQSPRGTPLLLAAEATGDRFKADTKTAYVCPQCFGAVTPPLPLATSLSSVLTASQQSRDKREWPQSPARHTADGVEPLPPPPVYDRRNFPCQKKQAFNGGLVWCVWPGLGAVRFQTGFPGNAIAPQGRPCSVGSPVTVFGWFSLSPSATLSGIGTVLHVQDEMELSHCDAFHSASVLTLVRSTQ